jgi:hypothetical protein
VRVAAEAAEVVNDLPFEPWVFGVGAFVGLVAMLLTAYAFKSVGTRH